MIHYLFKDEITFNNFCSNVNKYLDINGYLIITTFDANLINNLFLNNNTTHSEYFNNNDNNQEKFFEIIKKYDTINLQNFGLKIDVNVSIFMKEDEYNSEYLVEPDFLIKKLNEKCNLRLIETELFINIYKNYKKYFINNYENNSKYNNIKNLYNINNSEI